MGFSAGNLTNSRKQKLGCFYCLLLAIAAWALRVAHLVTPADVLLMSRQAACQVRARQSNQHACTGRINMHVCIRFVSNLISSAFLLWLVMDHHPSTGRRPATSTVMMDEYCGRQGQLNYMRTACQMGT